MLLYKVFLFLSLILSCKFQTGTPQPATCVVNSDITTKFVLSGVDGADGKCDNQCSGFEEYSKVKKILEDIQTEIDELMPGPTEKGPTTQPAGPTTQPAGPTIKGAGPTTQPAGPTTKGAGPTTQPAGPTTQPAGPTTQPAGPTTAGPL